VTLLGLSLESYQLAGKDEASLTHALELDQEAAL